MSSRVAHHIEFPDYTIDELSSIARLMLEAEQYRFDPDADEAFRRYLELRMRRPRFAHGRSVRNAIERARLRHANRIYESVRVGGEPSLEDLVRIDAHDILRSSVFDEPVQDGAPHAVNPSD
jgi:hypothetical protein